MLFYFGNAVNSVFTHQLFYVHHLQHVNDIYVDILCVKYRTIMFISH